MSRLGSSGSLVNRYYGDGVLCPEDWKKEMVRTLHKEHSLSDVFVAYVVDRYNRTQADLVDQLLTPVKSGWHEHFSYGPVSEKKAPPTLWSHM
jgi:hypothetical protein